MNRPLLLLVLVLALGVDSVVAQGTAQGAVVGTVSYRQRVALPADAVVEVRLLDTSRTDVAAHIIGEATIPTAGAQVPIPFRIEYNPAAIDPSHTYSVRAIINVGGKLLFSSTTNYPVLTRGAGNEAAIEVYMILPAGAAVDPGAKSGVSLENIFWKLVALGDKPAFAVPAAREAGFTLYSEGQRMSGSGGCNRLLGRYELGAGTLKLIPSGTTMMACADDSTLQEADFLSALKMTTGYRISGDTLELRNGDRVLARFMAQKNR
jgi:putative lipoprotein